MLKAVIVSKRSDPRSSPVIERPIREPRIFTPRDRNKPDIDLVTLPFTCIHEPFLNTQLKASGGKPIVITQELYDLLPEDCLNSGISIGSIVPYFWEVVDGSFPDGMALNYCSGLISGTPVEHGLFQPVIRITDGNGDTDQKTFFFCVIEITTPSELPEAVHGVTYSYVLHQTPGYNERWQIVGGYLPKGIELWHGALIGKPEEIGDFEFEVEVIANAHIEQAA